MASILNMWKDVADSNDLRVMKSQAEVIVSIPCHLRSLEAQAVLDTYEKKQEY